jgi:hypothetical protein
MIVTQDGLKYQHSTIGEDVLADLNADPLETKPCGMPGTKGAS